MLMNITVTGAAGASTPSMANMPGMGASSPSSVPTSTDAKIDFSATPGPSWHAFDPTLAPAPGGDRPQRHVHGQGAHP